jgi:RND family efflux transporter MFP subunit
MKNKKNLFIIIGIIAIVVFLISIRLVNKAAASKQDNQELTQTVEITDVQSGRIEDKLNYTGNIAGINEAMLISQTSGTVIKENVKVGERYSANQPLFVIENDMQKANVEQAKAQVLAAETNYEKAKNDLKRVERLFEDKVATKDNLELSQLNVKSALAGLKGAEAGLKVAEKQLGDTYISSKISGKLGSKKISVGGTVAPGTEIGKIVDDSRLKVAVLVSETDIAKLKTGQKVAITVDAIPGKSFEGKISTVGLATGEDGRSYQVEVMIDNSKNPEIKSGMFARCEIVTDVKDNVLVIPEKAIISNNDGSKQVFVVIGGKAIAKPVTVGIRTSKLAEISSGLIAGEKVIIVGQQRVENNAPVIVKGK